MGGGGHKAHESFVVSPSLTAATTAPLLVEESLDDDAADSLAAAAAVDQWLTAMEAEVAAAANGTVESAAPSDPVPSADLEADPELATPDPPAAEASAAAARPAAAAAQQDGAVTPVPTDPEPGAICGTPLLVGGADLDDSLATLTSYKSDGGPREVLMATVTPEAEAKLYEALALSEEKLVPVTVDKEVTGRLPADEAHQLYEQLATVAKSANHHLKAGDEIPEHTKENLAKALKSLEVVEGAAGTEADKDMLAHYAAAAAAIGERLNAPGAVAYDQGGKIPLVTPYETTATVAVTEYVPAPAVDQPDGLLGTKMRNATRIGATVGSDGTSSWDGNARTSANGKEYAIDLGDGYSAVYRPYAATGAKDPDFSHRGALEIIAPQGAGHGPELVRRLGQLNLVNRPMTAAEGEWSYLTRNIEAQGLANHPAVSAALADADGLEDATQELLIAERAHEAIGMDHQALVGFAKGLRLEAEAKALPEKVRLVREGVAKARGLPNGAALAASSGYDATPRVSGGWLVWDRFDVTADAASVRAKFGGKGLSHHVTNHNLAEILTNGGVLASTERRRVMGIKAGKGMSESSDMGSGGAKSVFLRVNTKPGSGPTLFWSDPTALLRRSDWYAYNGDHFGSINPQSGHTTSGQTRDPAKLAGFNGNNEVMFRHGVDLLGAEAPSLIKCKSAAERASVLKLLAGKGITELGGRPVAEVVQ